MPILSFGTYQSLNFHVIAPDLPGFGATEVPEKTFEYTFEKLAETLVLLLETLSISNFSVLCVGEYGVAVLQKLYGYRKNKISSIIIQNGSFFKDSRTNVSSFDLFQVRQKHISLPQSSKKPRPDGPSQKSRPEIVQQYANPGGLFSKSGSYGMPNTVCDTNDDSEDSNMSISNCNSLQASRKNSSVMMPTYSPKLSGQTTTSNETSIPPSSTSNNNTGSPYFPTRAPFFIPSNSPSMLDLSSSKGSSINSTNSIASNGLEFSVMPKLLPHHPMFDATTSSNITPFESSTVISSSPSLISFEKFKNLYQPKNYDFYEQSGFYNGNYSTNSSSVSLVSISSTVAEIESYTDVVDPSTVTLDYALLRIPGREKAQVSLYSDYLRNFQHSHPANPVEEYDNSQFGHANHDNYCNTQNSSNTPNPFNTQNTFNNPAAYSAQFSNNHNNRNPRPTWFKSISVPFLLLWGTGDAYVRSEQDEESICESFRENIPNATVEMFENAGHFAMELALKDIALIIEKFYKENPPEVSVFGLY